MSEREPTPPQPADAAGPSEPASPEKLLALLDAELSRLRLSQLARIWKLVRDWGDEPPAASAPAKERWQRIPAAALAAGLPASEIREAVRRHRSARTTRADGGVPQGRAGAGGAISPSRSVPQSRLRSGPPY